MRNFFQIQPASSSALECAVLYVGNIRTPDCIRTIRIKLLISQSRIKNDGLRFDVPYEIVVDVNVAFLVVIHGIAFADLNFLNQANQRGAIRISLQSSKQIR